MSGADHDQMDRMRSYLTNMCTGWDVEQVKSIVDETLHDIVTPLVFAEAADLIAEPQAVRARRRGGVGIRRGVGRADRPRAGRHPRDGHPDGRRGRQVHRRDRVLLLRRRQGAGDPRAGGARGLPLEHCYAYSDSITDLPMLEVVGHPSVVNPDRALRREAAGPRLAGAGRSPARCRCATASPRRPALPSPPPPRSESARWPLER